MSEEQKVNEQPTATYEESDPSGFELAKAVMDDWQSKGNDVYNKPLSRKNVDSILSDIYLKSGKKYTRATVYQARKTVLDRRNKDIAGNAGLNAKVTTDTDFEGGTPIIAKVEDSDGKKSDMPPLGEDKKQDPISPQAMHTILEAFLDMFDETLAKMNRPIPKERVKMCKELLDATADAYNASVPKSVLLPITAIAVLLTFAILPFSDKIGGIISQKLGRQPGTPYAEAQ